ncbi:MAG: hypothetical protein ACE5D2_08365, partial [Fidelibacterota bacterium]
LILGLTSLYLSNTVNLHLSVAEETYSSSQSYWSALSGIDYALEKGLGGLQDIPGNYGFFNSDVALSVYTTDPQGNPLGSDQVRVESISGHWETKRILDISMAVDHDQDVWPDTSVIEGEGIASECDECDGKVTYLTLQYNGSQSALIRVEQKKEGVVYNGIVSAGGQFSFSGIDKKGTLGTEIKIYINGNYNTKIHTSCSQPIGPGLVSGAFEVIYGRSRNGGDLCPVGSGSGDDDDEDKFKIEKDFQLNGSLYIGDDVVADEDASIGDPPGDPTHIWVPTGRTVTGDFDQYFSWSVYSYGSASLPSFIHSEYDSLIAIAQSITSTGGNKYFGNMTINGGTFDLSAYDNKTFFIKGNLTIAGGAVTGGILMEPGFIVTTGKIEIKEEHHDQSSIGDNLIFISDEEVKIKNQTQFGVDHSSLLPVNRPLTVNEVFSKGKVKIEKDAQVWAQIYAGGDVELKGSVYGLIYTTAKLKFQAEHHTEPFLEGYIFVHEIEERKLKKGILNIIPYYPLHYFSGFNFKAGLYSLKER